MRDKLMAALTRARETFSSFTTGQKAVAIVGTGALLVAAVMVFRWASTPSYAPLYSDLSGADASAVIEELEAQGVPYQITSGGGTVMVPRADVYTTRIALSGKGLPASSDGGYSILDEQGISTSEFKEQTDFKRAMEGELATTIEAIDGVETAVVHLAMPEKQVFADEQEPATASVLIDATHGTTLEDEQVQAIIHQVAFGVDGLDPKNVTVADSTGRVLSMPGEDGTGGNGQRNEQVAEFQDRMQGEIQTVLDRVLGAGNSTSTVTADLDFDKSVIESREYAIAEDVPPLSESNSSETYNGPAGAGGNGAGGTVGPDGQMDPGAGGEGGDSAYENTTETRDNAVNETVERRETAPGAVNSLHAGVVLDETAAAGIDPDQVEDLIRAAVGFNRQRGDTIDVSVMPFDRSAEEDAAAELAAAKAADEAAATKRMWRNVAIGAGIALMILLAWLQARRRARAREEATTYIVEQLRADAAARAPIEAPAPAVAALESVEDAEEDKVREELLALVEKQPEDVAALLRGWLVEPR